MSNQSISSAQEFTFSSEKQSKTLFMKNLKTFIWDLGKSSVEKKIKLILDGKLNKMSSSHMMSLGEGISQLRNTKELMLSFGGIETFDMFLEGKYQEAFPKLKTLQINTSIGVEDFSLFCKHLSTFIRSNTSTLQSFYLDLPSLCQVTNESFIALSKSLLLLRECPQLKELQLGFANWNVNLSYDLAFTDFCDAISQIIASTNLRVFSLNCAGWNITNTSIFHFSKALSQFQNKTSLCELKLNFTQVFRCSQIAIDSLAEAFTSIFSTNKIMKFYLCLNGWNCQRLSSLQNSLLNLKSVKTLCVHLKVKQYILNQNEESKDFMTSMLSLLRQNSYSKLYINFPLFAENNQAQLREIEQLMIERSNQHEILLNQFYTVKSKNIDSFRKEIIWDAIKIINHDQQQQQQLIMGNQRIAFELNN